MLPPSARPNRIQVGIGETFSSCSQTQYCLKSCHGRPSSIMEEDEFIHIGLHMLFAHAVMCALNSGFQVAEGLMDMIQIRHQKSFLDQQLTIVFCPFSSSNTTLVAAECKGLVPVFVRHQIAELLVHSAI